MKIRQFGRGEVSSILAIQARCPTAAVWSETDYARLAEDPRGMILVAELATTTPPKLVGFAAFHRIIDEAELRTIAVDPDHQHQGVGRAMVEEGCRRLRAAGGKRLYLEVRPSNRSALDLYYSAGFGLHAIRKGYYRNPSEDAYVLCLQLCPPEPIRPIPQP